MKYTGAAGSMIEHRYGGSPLSSQVADTVIDEMSFGALMDDPRLTDTRLTDTRTEDARAEAFGRGGAWRRAGRTHRRHRRRGGQAHLRAGRTGPGGAAWTWHTGAGGGQYITRTGPHGGQQQIGWGTGKGLQGRSRTWGEEVPEFEESSVFGGMYDSLSSSVADSMFGSPDERFGMLDYIAYDPEDEEDEDLYDLDMEVDIDENAEEEAMGAFWHSKKKRAELKRDRALRAEAKGKTGKAAALRAQADILEEGGKLPSPTRFLHVPGAIAGAASKERRIGGLKTRLARAEAAGNEQRADKIRGKLEKLGVEDYGLSRMDLFGTTISPLPTTTPSQSGAAAALDLARFLHQRGIYAVPQEGRAIGGVVGQNAAGAYFIEIIADDATGVSSDQIKRHMSMLASKHSTTPRYPDLIPNMSLDQSTQPAVWVLSFRSK